MDALNGIGVSNRELLAESGYDLSDIARRGADMFLKMVFRDGFYHADPHPGNLMVLQDAVIGVLDCGMVGRVDEELREQVEDLLMAAVDNDADRLLDTVVQLGELPQDFDRSRLRNDLVEFIDEYGSQSIDQFNLSGALDGMTAIIRRHHILLPSASQFVDQNAGDARGHRATTESELQHCRTARAVSIRGDQASSFARANVAEAAEISSRLEPASGVVSQRRIGHRQPNSSRQFRRSPRTSSTRFDRQPACARPACFSAIRWLRVAAKQQCPAAFSRNLDSRRDRLPDCNVPWIHVDPGDQEVG